jgi:hypothetical protein
LHRNGAFKCIDELDGGREVHAPIAYHPFEVLYRAVAPQGFIPVDLDTLDRSQLRFSQKKGDDHFLSRTNYKSVAADLGVRESRKMHQNFATEIVRLSCCRL